MSETERRREKRRRKRQRNEEGGRGIPRIIFPTHCQIWKGENSKF